MSEQQTGEQNATTPNDHGAPGDDPAVTGPATASGVDAPTTPGVDWEATARENGWAPVHDDPTADAGAPLTPDGPSATDQAATDGRPETDQLAPEGDGTVGDFGGDVRAFNERDSETDDQDRPVATFRSATGHDDSEPTV